MYVSHLDMDRVYYDMSCSRICIFHVLLHGGYVNSTAVGGRLKVLLLIYVEKLITVNRTCVRKHIDHLNLKLFNYCMHVCR